MNRYKIEGVYVMRFFVQVDQILMAEDEKEALSLALDNISAGQAHDEDHDSSEIRVTDLDEENQKINDLGDLLDLYGVESMAQLGRQVYKQVACGPWLKEIDDGLVIGSIVEGHDAEFECTVEYPFAVGTWRAKLEDIDRRVDEYLEETDGE